jgi:hypothetical protein
MSEQRFVITVDPEEPPITAEFLERLLNNADPDREEKIKRLIEAAEKALKASTPDPDFCWIEKEWLELKEALADVKAMYG